MRHLGPRYAMVTGVTRDDLPDDASWTYAETYRQIHELCPGMGVELLVGDFQGDVGALRQVFGSRPEVFAHSLGTVPRISKRARPASRYGRPLDIIVMAPEEGFVTRSDLILGMSETREKIEGAMAALRGNSCGPLTITQYLRSSPLYHPIDRWVKPKGFIELRDLGRKMGFTGVVADPLVRSSYRTGRLYGITMTTKGLELPPGMGHLGEPMEARQEASWLLSKGRDC